MTEKVVTRVIGIEWAALMVFKHICKKISLPTFTSLAIYYTTKKILFPTAELYCILCIYTVYNIFFTTETQNAF